MKHHRTVVVVAAALAVAACGKPKPENAPQPSASAPPPMASSAAPAPPPPPPPAPAKPAPVDVKIEARSGSKLAGTAHFEEVDGGVKVTLSLSGLTKGSRAAHVHETGDCSAPDAKSAGGHFNPDAHPHGMPAAGERHLGDLGNIEIGADGTGSLEIVVAGATLAEGDAHSFLGRAVVVHEKKDDGGQPTGNAGGRIGCAEIKR